LQSLSSVVGVAPYRFAVVNGKTIPSGPGTRKIIEVVE
jgi:hypothetical protein